MGIIFPNFVVDENVFVLCFVMRVSIMLGVNLY